MKFHEDWFSQAGQDKWVCEFFNNKMNGYFLDIGAGDGIGDSNTYYLEKKLNWTGLCIECGVKDYLACKSIRSAKVLNHAVYSKECNLNFTISTHSVTDKPIYNAMPVHALTLEQVFKKHNVPLLIDYVSLDIEGSELEALKGWPWATHKAILFTIEHNCYRFKDSSYKDSIYEFITKRGYVRTVEDVTCKDSNWGSFEDWYVHKDYIK